MSYVFETTINMSVHNPIETKVKVGDTWKTSRNKDITILTISDSITSNYRLMTTEGKFYGLHELVLLKHRALK